MIWHNNRKDLGYNTPITQRNSFFLIFHYVCKDFVVWRRSVVKFGVRVSQVKPSNCFGLHPTSVISKVPNIQQSRFLTAPWKISFTFQFRHKSFILDDVKLAELSNNSFEWKDVTFLRGGQSILLTHPTYFRGVKIPNPRIYAHSCCCG